jgi:hypothetical protein
MNLHRASIIDRASLCGMRPDSANPLTTLVSLMLPLAAGVVQLGNSVHISPNSIANFLQLS